MKHLKLFENFNNSSNEDLIKFKEWLSEKNFELYDGEEDFDNKFIEVTSDDSLTTEEKSHEIAAFLDEKWGLYDGYIDVIDYLEELLKDI
jgi:hypothetical protein